MIINHNMGALNANRNANINAANASKSMQKLSSGMRINSAADDAAGLAISEKMRGQINGLTQASANAQDGISLSQTAEGALNETSSILQRMRQLAVQGATDTNTTADRSNIQDEVKQLSGEIDRIANTTQFNTKNLLDGSMGAKVSANISSVAVNMAVLGAGGATATTAATLTGITNSASSSLNITSGSTVNIAYETNGKTVNTSVTVAAGTALTDLQTTDFTFATVTGGALGATGTLAAAKAGTTGGLAAVATAAGFAGGINGLSFTVKDRDGVVNTAATNALSAFTETQRADDKRTDGSATFQIGANVGQSLNLSINNMGAAALGIKDLKVGTQAQANVAISVIDAATAKVSSERSKLGAIQNRLDHTINNLGTSSENLTSAESRIRDVDMAAEMSNFSKNNILSQAAQAMLSQANQQPQQVLQLLR